MLEHFFELPPNSFGIGAFIHYMEGHPHPEENLMSYDACINELVNRDDFFHYDSAAMVISNLNNEELLKTAFLFGQNGLEKKDWCEEIKERMQNDLFSSEDIPHGLDCIKEYCALFGESLDADCSEKLCQIMLVPQQQPQS